MTVLIGVYCEDGVVIGADGVATFGSGQFSTIEQQTQKITILDEKIIIAGTGEVGLGQRFTAIVDSMRAGEVFDKQNPIDVITNMSHHTINNFKATHVPLNKIGLGALVAFPCQKRAHLCEFGVNTFQPELKDDRLWYVSMGGGQHIADPFLALMRTVFWKDGLPKRQDAVFAVTWALTHAIECNPGGINDPIQIAELSLDAAGEAKARLLDDDELSEHKQNVQGAVEHLRKYQEILRGDFAEEVPDIPVIEDIPDAPIVDEAVALPPELE